MSRHKNKWDRIYHHYSPKALPWELGKPRRLLVELVESGQIVPGKTLDLCCGVGTNPIYLAQKGFDITALDLSDKAVEYTKEKVTKTKVDLNLLIASYLALPFKGDEFDLIFDFGCFHHVKVEERTRFILEVYRSIKSGGRYLLVCFSDRNGQDWNHFTEEQIVELFRYSFKILWIKHISSLEGDGITRYFYEVFMEKK
jgi:cyclopropane fatty-acyl-phospholipid synthase-like methyltransferase